VLEGPCKLIVKVPCAIIEHEGLILAGQRNPNISLGLKWEFPGGKLEENETELEALHREILEELNVSITVHHKLPVTIRDDGHRDIWLIPFVCSLNSYDIALTEHVQIRWLRPEELLESDLDWADADKEVIHDYLRWLSEKS
jgi:8-oxo-dGTP diphosphatase